MKYRDINNIFKYIILILAFFLVSCASYKLKTDKNLLSGQLENGLKYYIYGNKTPEKAVHMGILFHVGSLHEEENERGLAHYLEHMAFKGTKDYPGGDGIFEVLKKFGMAFGADINAHTGFDQTYYHLDLPDGNNETEINEALNVLKNWASQIEFNEVEIDKERNVIIEEKKRVESYPSRLTEKVFPFILGNSRYTVRLPIGLEERILSFKSEDFKKFYKKWYRPDLTSVIIVGDIEPSEIEKKVKEQFSSLEKPSSEIEKIKMNLDTVMSEKFLSVEDIDMPFPNITFVKKDIHNIVSTSGEIKRDIEKTLLDGLFENRFSELKTSGLNYLMSFDSSDISFKSDDNYILINQIAVNFNPDHLKEGIEGFFYEMERIKKFGFTQGEVDKIKAQLISSYKISKDNIGKRDSSMIANLLLKIALERSQMLDMNEYYDIAIEHLNKLSLKSISDFAKSQASINDRAIMYAYSNDKYHPSLTLEEIQELREIALKRDTKPYDDVSIQGEFFKKSLENKDIINEKELSDGVSSFTLENGVEVYFKHNEHRKNMVTLSASSWGGVLSENADFIPVLSLAPGIVSSSGYGDYSSLQVEKYLSGKVVSLSPRTGDQTSSINGSADVKDLETLFQLIYFTFNEPKIDDIVLQNNIDNIKAEIKSNKNNSKYLFGNAVGKFRTNDDYRFRDIQETDLKNVSKDILLDFYKKKFTYANNFKFVFVGDVDLETIKTFSRKYLGNLSSKKLDGFKDLDYSYKRDVERIVVRKGEDASSIVRIFYPFEFKYTPESALNYEGLVLLLTESLIKSIRREMSSVYSINAYFDCDIRKYGNSDGFIIVAFTVEPKALDNVLRSVSDHLLERQKTEFGDDDFNYVKKNLIKNQDNNSESDWYWTSKILHSVLWYDTFIDTFSIKFIEKNLNKDVINSLIKKLNFNQRTEIVLIPEKSN
ncbi:M16 family metallopeptidase [Candidatus Borreliella tachyglossi]|uniref:M16 family metallopeptidase n=1 Tax=Candidatus Borreliella tachyglossi TaxID=1964448 RepID=UPI0040437CB9